MTGIAIALAVLLQAQPPIFVPPAVQGQRLIHRVSPVYPELAKRARIHGMVKLAAIIDENGVVDRLKLVSGHPLLVKAAFDAVKQWRYRPAMRGGSAVAVITTIEITFTMDGKPPAPYRAGSLPISHMASRSRWL